MKSRFASIRTACARTARASRRCCVAPAARGLLALLLLALPLKSSSAAAPQDAVASPVRLEELLKTADISAVEEAGRLGPPALPVIRRYVKHENYRSRQLAMRCAGRIGVDQGADILAAGLVDQNFNVQNTAANELAKRAYPGAAAVVLKQLAGRTDELVKEKLALAAGRLPGPRSLELLKPIAKGRGVLAVNARMALARLNDRQAQQTLIAELRGSSPRVRYDALEKLVYVNDRAYAPHVKRLLDDKAEAVRVGIVEMPRYRRVCDQAVDTSVSLFQAATSFPINPDKIYSDEEISRLKASIKWD
jgi:HEAT repeat protein